MTNVHLNHYRKGVVCLNYGVVYESIELAGKLTSCNPDCIRHVCKGRQRTTKTNVGVRLKWMYLTDYVKQYGLDNTLELRYMDRLDYLEEVHNDKVKIYNY